MPCIASQPDEGRACIRESVIIGFSEQGSQRTRFAVPVCPDDNEGAFRKALVAESYGRARSCGTRREPAGWGDTQN